MSIFEKKKSDKTVFLFIFVVLVIIVPFMVTIYYSTISADDFSMALKDYGFIQSLNAAAQFYNYWGGGFPYNFLEFLLNPLQFGPAYCTPVGLILNGFFIIFIISLYFLIKTVTEAFFLKKENKHLIWSIYCLVLFGVLNAGIFPEIYYWFVGNSYLWVLTISLLSIIGAIRYFNQPRRIWRCVLFSFLCFIAGFGYQYAVWTGLSYIFIWYVKSYKTTNKIRFLDILPLLFMIVGGCLSVFAPGNFIRHAEWDSTGLHVFDALVYALKNLVKCGFDLIINPVFVVCIALVFFGGYKYTEKKLKINPLVIYLLGFISIYCVLFPVALGYSLALLPNRQLFVIKVPMILISGFCSFYTGNYIQERVQFTKWIKVAAGFFAAILIGIGIFARGGFSFPWLKTFASINDVRNEQAYYNGLLEELEKTEEKSVILKRKTKDLPRISGIIANLYISPDPDNWINTAIASWFDKDRVVLILENESPQNP